MVGEGFGLELLQPCQPRLIDGFGRLLPDLILRFEFVVCLPALDSAFDAIDVGVGVPELALDLFADVRIDQIVDLVLEIHLVLSDESHIVEPIFVVCVFEADAGKLPAVHALAFVVVVLLELLLVRLPDFAVFDFLALEVGIVTKAHPSEGFKFGLVYLLCLFGQQTEEGAAELLG